MSNLINENLHYITLVYLCCVFISLFIRCSLAVVCIHLSENTRLKEIKNLSIRTADSCLKKSYMSLFWPHELISHLFRMARYFFKK